MGSAIGDFDNDGRLDWYLTSVYADGGSVSKDNGNMLYVNQGEHRYRELSEAAGVNNGGWGWGAVAVDLDHDGLLDLVATNGWEKPNPEGLLEWISEPTHVFLNRGGLSFHHATFEVGLVHRKQGRGLLHFDYDNDGDQDLLIVNQRGPVSLYRNELSGPGTNWLRVFADTRGAPHLAPDGLGTPGGGAGRRPLAVPRHPRRQHLQRRARACPPTSGWRMPPPSTCCASPGQTAG